MRSTVPFASSDAGGTGNIRLPSDTFRRGAWAMLAAGIRAAGGTLVTIQRMIIAMGRTAGRPRKRDECRRAGWLKPSCCEDG